jgi:hypothetical protein
MQIVRRQFLHLAVGVAVVSAVSRAARVQIPAHRGQSFRRIADSNPVIADSF